MQHQLKELVAKVLSDSRQDLLRQFSAEDGHNPLADFKAAVVREVKRSGESHEKLIEKIAQLEGEVKRLHDAREAEAELAAERERGTGKGREFEQQAFELVEQMAAARGDVAHHVGDERSASGGKKGDIVIELDAASGAAKGRIAIDAKDEKLSKNAAWAVLNAALAERDAGFAILRRRLRREGALRARAAARVRGQQDDRRARQGDHRRPRASSSPTATPAAAA